MSPINTVIYVFCQNTSQNIICIPGGAGRGVLFVLGFFNELKKENKYYVEYVFYDSTVWGHVKN